MFDKRGRATYEGDFHVNLAADMVAAAEIRPGEHILDIATGTGLVSLAAAKLVGHEGHVHGLDLSKGMLRQQQAAIDEQRISNVSLQVDNAESANLDVGALYDVITCCCAMTYMATIGSTLQLWRTWLKPGGRLVVNAFESPMNPDHGLFCDIINSESTIQMEEPNARFGSEQACKAVVEQAGYKEVQVTPIPGQHFAPATNVAAYAESLWQRSAESVFWPLDSAGFSPQQLSTLRSKFVAAVTAKVEAQGRWRDGGVTVGFVNLIVTART